MNGPTDPALRALKDEVEALRYKYEPGSVSAAYENGWYDGRGAALQVIYDRLAAAEAAPPLRQRCTNCGETDYIVDDAAAEAAPLDDLCSPYYERGWKAGKAAAEAAPLDVLFAPYFEAHPNAADDEDNEWCMKHLPRIAQVRVALRSPDTETCPDCGLTAERIGQMHITAQRLRSPDTETAGEAG